MASAQTTSKALKLKQTQDNLENTFSDQAFRLRDGGYPARYFAEDEDEKDLRALQAYARELNLANVPAYYMIDKKDINIVKKKSAARTLAQYDSFIETLFNLNDPKDVRLIKEITPDYFTRREDELNRKLELQKKVNKIMLFGVQSKDDVDLLFAMHSGDITLSPNASWYLPDLAVANEIAKYTRGFYNVHRLWDNYQRRNGPNLGLFNRTTGAPANVGNSLSPDDIFTPNATAMGDAQIADLGLTGGPNTASYYGRRHGQAHVGPANHFGGLADYGGQYAQVANLPVFNKVYQYLRPGYR